MWSLRREAGRGGAGSIAPARRPRPRSCKVLFGVEGPDKSAERGRIKEAGGAGRAPLAFCSSTFVPPVVTPEENLRCAPPP